MPDNPPCNKPQRSDYERALESMDTFMDVSVDDLMSLAQRAEEFATRRRVEDRQVTRIMSGPVHSVQQETSMAEAAHLMVSRRISGLPVVDADGILTGIITEADFLRALGVPAHDPTQSLWHTLENLFSHLGQHGELTRPDDAVSAHMQASVVTVSVADDVFAALEQMKAHKVKRLVVIDAERRPVGMITRSDLVRIFFDRFTEHRDSPPA